MSSISFLPFFFCLLLSLFCFGLPRRTGSIYTAPTPYFSQIERLRQNEHRIFVPTSNTMVVQFSILMLKCVRVLADSQHKDSTASKADAIVRVTDSTFQLLRVSGGARNHCFPSSLRPRSLPASLFSVPSFPENAIMALVKPVTRALLSVPR